MLAQNSRMSSVRGYRKSLNFENEWKCLLPWKQNRKIALPNLFMWRMCSLICSPLSRDLNNFPCCYRTHRINLSNFQKKKHQEYQGENNFLLLIWKTLLLRIMGLSPKTFWLYAVPTGLSDQFWDLTGWTSATVSVPENKISSHHKNNWGLFYQGYSWQLSLG